MDHYLFIRLPYYLNLQNLMKEIANKTNQVNVPS